MNKHNQSITDAIKFFQQGDLKASKKIVNNIIKIDANNIDGNFLLGIILNEEKEFIRALQHFDLVIKEKPNDPEVWNYRAISLFNINRIEDSIINFEKSLDLGIIHREKVFKNLILAIFQKNKNQMNADYSKAIKYSKDVLKLNDKDTQVLINLGLAYIYQIEPDKAIRTLKDAIKINPNLTNAYTNIGLAYKYLNNYEMSEVYYKKSLNLNENDEVRIPLGQVQLSQLKFAEGWKNFIYYTFKLKKNFFSNSPIPLWNPNLGYGDILIWGQYGLGEQILFSSILPDMIKKFNKITFMVEKRLVEIMSRTYNQINIIEKNNDLDLSSFDYHLPITSLGLYFRKSLNDFKNHHIILKVENQKLLSRKNLRCAISWKSTNPEFGELKSLDFNSLAALSKMLKSMNIEIYNIQYTDENEDIDRIKSEHNIDILSPENINVLNDIDSLVKFINDCDFVISISNTNAHLSAAINKKTYLLLPKGAGTIWYWENELNGKNLWYPSISKLQQKQSGDWSHVINQLNIQIQRDFSVSV